jgi:hypothetical protein
MKRLLLTIAACALLCSAQVQAGPITYTLTTTASGTLGASSFTNALVTVTLTGDTSNVTAGPDPFNDLLVNPGSATVSVSGLGTATFTGSIEIISTFNDLTLFGVPAVLIAQLDNPAGTSVTGILVQTGSVFSSYDLRGPLGPVSGTGGVASGSRGATPIFSTTAGNMTWATFQPLGTSTFTAAATPAPGTLSPSGSFGFLINASYGDPSKTNGSAILGVMNFDGAGNVTGSYTSEPDTQADQTNAGALTGTYSSSPDGTGSVTITLDTNASFTFAMVITDGGQGLQLVATKCSADCDNGGNATISGIARAAYAGPVKGSYGFQLSISPKPAVSVGVMNFDGAGNVTQLSTFVGLSGTSGQPAVFPLGAQPGTYSTNPDGSGTLSFAKTADNNAQTYAFVITDGGSALLLVQTRRLGNGVQFGTARLQ